MGERGHTLLNFTSRFYLGPKKTTGSRVSLLPVVHPSPHPNYTGRRPEITRINTITIAITSKT